MIPILLLDLGKEMRGGQWQVYYLARALAHSGEFAPIVAAPSSSPLLEHVAEVSGVRIVPLGDREWDPRSLYALRRLVRREGVRILHSHCAKSATLATLGKKFWPAEVLLVHSRRVSYPLKPGWRGKKYSMADAVVGVSREISEVVIASGVPAERVLTIHSGIDRCRYTPRRDRGDGRKVIGMVGAFTPQKGQDVLVRALAELDAAYTDLPPWEVRFIGTGELFGSVSALAAELGVDTHIAMLGRQDSRVFLPDFDLLVVPSVEGEGSSGTIKEGWAVGLPVVCSDLPSNLELVENDRNGLVFPNRDHTQLARLLARLLTDAPLRERLVVEGGRSADAFSDLRMAAAYMDLYRTLAARPAGMAV